jgi:hypothetical protein
LAKRTQPRQAAPERRSRDADRPTLATYFGAIVGGALLGGVALALLNRKTIQELREKLDQSLASPDDVY